MKNALTYLKYEAIQCPEAHWKVPFLHLKSSQFSSSLPSPQSSSWSHLHRLEIHLPLPQRNSDSEHSRYFPLQSSADSSMDENSIERKNKIFMYLFRNVKYVNTNQNHPDNHQKNHISIACNGKLVIELIKKIH